MAWVYLLFAGFAGVLLVGIIGLKISSPG